MKFSHEGIYETVVTPCHLVTDSRKQTKNDDDPAAGSPFKMLHELKREER